MTRIIGALFAAMLLWMGVLGWQLQATRNELARAKLAPAKAAAVRAAARVDTVREQLAGSIRTVTKTIASVRVDTLIVRPTTPAETLTVVRQAPAVAAKLDSTQRACSALVMWCVDYRLAAETRFANDSTYILGLETQARANRPSRFGAAWNRVKLPLAFSLGVYAGVRAR